ncbi:MAG: glycosyltransferase family 4 protein [Leptolyngbyaceae cyanobacterium]
MTSTCQANASPVVKEHRTLFLVQVKPYPLSGGVSLRNWHNIILLAHQGPVAIFSLYKGGTDSGSLPLSATWEHYDLSAPSRPILEKLQRRFWRFRATGHARADWLYTQDAANQLRQRIAIFNPTLIIVEEIWLYRYLPILQQIGCPLILDNHNVEGDENRYQEGDSITYRMLPKVKCIEERFIRAVDQVWMCSQEDVRRLHQLYSIKDGTAYVIPNGVNPDYYKTASSCHTLPNDTKTLIYLGRFSYQPNAEAASILLNQIYPLLKKSVGNCQLLLVGCDPTKAMLNAAQADANIVVTGQVDDVRPYLARATVMVVPLLKGSGTRLKHLEAFAAKCPVISTTKGAEGLEVEDEKQLLLRDSPATMVEAIQQLWQEPHRAQALTEDAYRYFLERYTWSAVGQKIQRCLAQLSR